MGFFNDLNRKKIGFNPHPFSKQKKKKEHDIDLHLEVTRKLDEAIARNKESVPTDNKDITIPKFIEIREPSFRSPGIPAFQSDLNPKGGIGELNDIQEFVEIEPPTNFLMQKEPEFDSWMINQSEKDQKTYWGFGHIRIRTIGKESEKTQTNKSIETTIAKIELEETKKEIERKKKELEDALKKEKEKTLLVKKEEEEKRKQEKLRKIELKKKLKEEKIKEKLEKKAQTEMEKAQKEKEIQLKKQELIKGEAPEEKTVQEEKIQPDIIDIFEEKEEYHQENISLDEDVAKLLPIIDSLFEKLPEEVVDEFTKSEYFELYEKVLLKYKNK